MTALLVFEQAAVDVVVLEVGMGGRLDATNIIPDSAVLASALTAVDLDHQAFLGATVEAIAGEKAAIAREGRPFVLGPQKHSQVQAVVKKIVSDLNGQLINAYAAETREWDDAIDGLRPQALFRSSSMQAVSVRLRCFPEPIRTLLPLLGRHQLDNLGIAASIISSIVTSRDTGGVNFAESITPSTVAAGVRSTSWPGRLSFHRISLAPASAGRRPMTVLVDGAHNPASSSTLASYISGLLSDLPASITSVSLTYILALSHSPPKTPSQTLTPLLPPEYNGACKIVTNVASVGFSSPDDMPWVRHVAPDNLNESVKQLSPTASSRVFEGSDRTTRLRDALEWAWEVSGGAAQTNEAQLVILAGSLYLVADFYRLLKAGSITVAM